MKHNWKKLFCIILPLAVGALSAFLSRSGMNEYNSLDLPPLSPPGWVFPVVWTILYLLMGISSCLIARSDSPDKKRDLRLYGIQLFLNFIWSPIFFTMENYLLAFLVLVLLWIFILLMIRSFSAIDPLAGKLQIPYLIWVTFAGYLNLFVYLLNR